MKKLIMCMCVIGSVLTLTACGSQSVDEVPTSTLSPTYTPVQPTATSTPRPTAKMPPESTIVYLEPVYHSIGAENVTYFFSTSYVNDIAFDQEGVMWVATNGGVLRWDLTNDSFTKFTSEDGFEGDWVDSMIIGADGSIWAISGESLFYFDGLHWNIEIEASGTIIGFDSEGKLWAYDHDSISYFEESEWNDVGNPQVDSPFWGILDAEIGMDNTIWVASWEGFWSYDDNTWTSQSSENGLAGIGIGITKVSNDGRVWVGTDEGLFSFDGRIWEMFPLPVENQMGDIVDLLTFESGKLWASYDSYEDPDSSGIYTYEGERWDRISIPDEFKSLMTTTMEGAPDGAVYIGTNVGVLQLEGDVWQRFLNDDEPIGNQIGAVYQSQEGILWFGTDNGISRYDGSEWLNFMPSSTYGSYIPYLQCFAETLDGRLISVGGQGIYVLEDGQWDLLIESPEWDIDPTIPSAVFESLYISSLEVSVDGNIWVSGNFFADPYPGLGVFRYDGENWFHYTFEDWLGELLTLDGEFIKTGVLPSDDIFAMAVGPDGALWIGADEGGVIRFDGETWVTLSGPDYFPGDSILEIAKGPDDSLWFATQNGFSHFDGYDWTVYDLGGDPSSFDQATIAVDSQGIVWYRSGLLGLSSFDGETFSIYSVDAEGFEDISRPITIDKQGTIWLGSWYEGLMTISIP